MIRIRQHGDDNNIFDITHFLEDIDVFFAVDKWKINIEWCSGGGAKSIEEVSIKGKVYSDKEFRVLYAGIFQTIDGSFHLSSNNVTLARLKAVDSSFWEVESENRDFMNHMLNKYGAYEYTSA